MDEGVGDAEGRAAERAPYPAADVVPLLHRGLPVHLHVQLHEIPRTALANPALVERPHARDARGQLPDLLLEVFRRDLSAEDVSL